jgi:hypothetical protein
MTLKVPTTMPWQRQYAGFIASGMVHIKDQWAVEGSDHKWLATRRKYYND